MSGVRIFLLLFSLISAAPLLAQSSEAASDDCLLTLKSPNADFAATAQAHKAQVIAHSGSNLNWWLKAEDCPALRALPDVASVSAPSSVIVSLNRGAPLPKADIEKLGGIVYHDFASISAASIVLPSEKVAALAALPGIKQVREDRSVSPTRKPASTGK